MLSDRLFFFEEGIKSGGIAEGFAIKCVERGYKGEINITAIDGVFVQHATVAQSLGELRLDADSVYETIKAKLSE